MAVATVTGQQSISQEAALATLPAHKETLPTTSLGVQEHSCEQSTSHETTHAPTGANTEYSVNVASSVVPTTEGMKYNQGNHQDSDSDDGKLPSLRSISDDEEDSDDEDGDSSSSASSQRADVGLREIPVHSYSSASSQRADISLREIPVCSMQDLNDLVYNPRLYEDGTTVSLEKSICDDVAQ